MKKQFKVVGMLAFVLTAFLMCTSVNAVNDVSIAYQGDSVFLQVKRTSSVESSVLIRAIYDENGKMSDVDTYDVTYDEFKSANVRLKPTEGNARQELFVWDSLDNAVPLAHPVIPDTHRKITANSKMALVSEVKTAALDGENIAEITAYTAGMGADEDGKVTIYVDKSTFADNTDISLILKEGTPFYYTLNSKGYADRIDVLNAIDYTDSKSIQRAIFGSELTGSQTVTAIINPAMASDTVISGISYSGGNQMAIQQCAGDENNPYDKAVFKLAPVIKKGNGALFFMTGDEANGYFASDLDEGYAHMITNGTTVVVCDLSASKNKVKSGTLADVQPSRFIPSAKVAYTGDYRNFVAWDKVVDDNSYNDNSDIVYALVKLLDDDITEIYVILPEES